MTESFEMSAHGDEFDEDPVRLAYRLAGATQAFHLTSAMTRMHMVMALKQVHESGAYKELDHTWEEYCEQVVGISVKSVYEAFQNLEELGPDFMQAAEHLGLTRAVLRGLRRLPEDARPRVLESGEIAVADRTIPMDPEKPEGVRDLLEDIVAGQQEMREQNQELQERLEKQMEVGSQQLDEKDDEIAELKQEREKLLRDLEAGEDRFIETPAHRALADLFFRYKLVCELVDEEQPEPEYVLKWMRQIAPMHSDLLAYGAEYNKDFDPTEHFDPEAVEAHEEFMREHEDEL